MITSEEKRQLHILLDDVLENEEYIGKVGLVDWIDQKIRVITLKLEIDEHKLD